MVQTLELVCSPETAGIPEELKAFVALELGLDVQRIKHVHEVRKSIDARKSQVKIRLRCDVFVDEFPPIDLEKIELYYPKVHTAEEVHIVGSGPSGLFAALRLIERGFRPIVIERGKDVKERRKDLSALHVKHIVNPDSNYCFGEGGAGTYSDGKLYTRSKKRGDLERILRILVGHGAAHEILVDAHPHIGTNKLPKIIANMRNQIIESGGEVHFNTRVIDFDVQGDKIVGITTLNGDKISVKHLILATGHSARDIFELLHRKKVLIEAKAFAMGVRIEHPQRLIDSIQYHCSTDRGRYLPAASYSLVEQVKGRGVYSFCMCPGGQIVPSATAPGEVVVNGMSASTRSSRYANSGMVVAIEQQDWQQFGVDNPLAAMQFQQEIEQLSCTLAGGTQSAPAQRMVDFVEGKVSGELNPCSYIPGIQSAPLHEALPKLLRERLQLGFLAFGKKMKGYYTNEAQILAVESRTSSPVRIPRDKEKLHHPQITNLYPCGEGAGYAGGIVSAAMDGERVAEKI